MVNKAHIEYCQRLSFPSIKAGYVCNMYKKRTLLVSLGQFEDEALPVNSMHI